MRSVRLAYNSAIIHTIIGYSLASAPFLAWVAFGVALATSPTYTTIKGWHERSDLGNTLRIVGAALGLIVGLDIVLGALTTGIALPH